MNRWIAHVDMDSFFVSVERLRDPSLIGRPVVVGGTGPRAVVSSASYEARKFGVRSAMPMAQARRLSRELVIVAPHFSDYERYSRLIFTSLREVSPIVEQVSVDEAFLDFTGCEKLYPTWETALARIRESVHRASGLTCSVGMASNKMVAKIASDINKPNGFCFVDHGKEGEFMSPLRLQKIPGVGPKLNARLENCGLTLCRDLTAKDSEWIRRRLGTHGVLLQKQALGIDHSPVSPGGDRKSLGAERTFSKDLIKPEELLEQLRNLVTEVARSLREERLMALTIQIKIRFRDFRTITRAKTLSVPTHLTRDILETATGLFKASRGNNEPVRLIGVTCRNFVEHNPVPPSVSHDGDQPTPDKVMNRPLQQLSLFESPQVRIRDERVDQLRDQLKKRFGKIIRD